MSTYYYICCTDCKVKLDNTFVVTRVSGNHFDNQPTSIKFLKAHILHNLMFFSEHDDELCDYPIDNNINEAK